MFGLVVIEVMTPSGHLSNINEIGLGLNQYQIYSLNSNNLDRTFYKQAS
jgi:hypothetical protein